MYDQLFEFQADLLKSLAHPRRLEIVQLLRDQEMCVTDIYEMLDLPQANISQHLMILRDAKVVEATRDGKQIVYRLSHPQVLEACDNLRDVLIDQHKGDPIVHQLKLKMKDLMPVVHDPVCQMRVSPRTAGSSHTYNSTEYYFCATGCSKKFKEEPEKYVNN